MDGLFPDGTPAEKDALVRLRQELDVFAGLRPARAYDALLDRTPFRDEVVRGVDIMVLREQCGRNLFWRATRHRCLRGRHVQRI